MALMAHTSTQENKKKERDPEKDNTKINSDINNPSDRHTPLLVVK